MKIERGVHTAELRIRLTLQSEDVDTHSVMSDNAELFSVVVDQLGEEAIRRVNFVSAEFKEKKTP